MTGHQKLQGTLSYMAPEQILQESDVSYAADIYGLGGVLYEVLAGQVAFEAEYTHEVLEAVKTQIPATPSSLSKFPIPGLLEDLAMQCLRKAPDERPDITEFIRTLQEDWFQDMDWNRKR